MTWNISDAPDIDSLMKDLADFNTYEDTDGEMVTPYFSILATYGDNQWVHEAVLRKEDGAYLDCVTVILFDRGHYRYKVLYTGDMLYKDAYPNSEEPLCILPDHMQSLFS